MRRRRVYTDYLHDIIHYCNKIKEFVAGLDYKHFAEDEEKVLAVTHALQIIGEAVNRLPVSLKQRYPEVPWVDIVGMRNIIVHGYFLVDLKVIWETIHESLPPLRMAAVKILREIERSEEE
ncbi:MAG: DUF86 domain-containing protein [Planctomycetes bacterium]|nr:DUF86 domain-containing protein [Planctomycetota bacterium]